MNSKFIFVACFLIIFVAFASGTTRTYGACSCKCWNSYCENPTSADQCSKCSKSVSGIDGSTSMDDGVCWIKVGSVDQGRCSKTCMTVFGGCSHYAGYTFQSFTGSCWCKWNK